MRPELVYSQRVTTVERGTETPNQREKQQQIVEATREVLARDGLAGCTARAVADASPLTKSAVHYYFHDINEIVDQAMDAHLAVLLDTLRHVAASERDPARRLWHVIDAYLATFTDKPRAAHLWFEYWIALSRRGATDPVRRNLSAIRELLHELLLAAHHPNPHAAADTVLSWLLGAVVQQDIDPRPRQGRRRDLERLLDLSAG